MCVSATSLAQAATRAESLREELPAVLRRLAAGCLCNILLDSTGRSILEQQKQEGGEVRSVTRKDCQVAPGEIQLP